MMKYNGPERRVADPRWERAEKQLRDLDDGQLHIIRRLDAQDDVIAANTKTSEQTLAETKTIRELSENMQAAGRFFNGLATFVHRTAKFVAPILAAGLAVWGIVWAWTHGGKPPS